MMIMIPHCLAYDTAILRILLMIILLHLIMMILHATRILAYSDPAILPTLLPTMSYIALYYCIVIVLSNTHTVPGA